jgi:prepilin-type N-terminal cleavage/methylation domain-containing protein
MRRAMRNVRNQNGGFTLIELVLALAIMGVIASAVTLMIVTATRVNNSALIVANARNNAAAALTIIKDDLLYCSAAELRNNTNGDNEQYKFVATQFQLVNVDETDGILLAGDTSDLNGDGLVDGLVLGFDNS